MQNFQNELGECLHTGFVDKSSSSKRDYLPLLLVNDKVKKEKVLTSLLKELDSCEEFLFSVAFVTKNGVATIINLIKELETRGVQGKIIVSQYQNFTEPEALRALIKFKNIELRIVTEGNFHSKAYIFRKGPSFHVIIGSSNLTANALCYNKEMNVKLTSNKDGLLIHSILENFRKHYREAKTVDEEFIRTYTEVYQKNLRKTLEQARSVHVVANEILPNKMQIEALKSLRQLRLDGKNKALIISATGTGKTYLCAFDIRESKPKRVLFIVHRLNIAQKSLKSFRDIIDSKVTMGLYSGENRQVEADYIFSTVQTLARKEHLERFKPDHFDYVVIDETHRSGAESYQRILAYLKPNFLLGMTATPERQDGFDIFQQFDNNLAFEIRLHQALEEQMLCNFHYYGVADVSVNNEIIEEKSGFNLLFAEERVERIIETSRFYGCDNGIVRGLIFCSRIEECIYLSNEFNKVGYRTVPLSGSSSAQERQEAIELLESNDLTKKLHYIFSVDILNEGIDIPKVNQIIMLRPTQSAIVFVQQLGRGLRKAEGKDHLTVIDFIGNYSNNFLVPIALFGDTSYNKDSIRKLLKQGNLAIPGASTINFDPIAKQQIFAAIDRARLDLLKDLKEEYNLLKMRIGRHPMMMDFISNNMRDPFVFVSTCKSYLNFVARVENQGKLPSRKHMTILELFSNHICNGKRIEEVVIVKELILNGSVSYEQVRALTNGKYGVAPTDETIRSSTLNLNFDFIRTPHKIVKDSDQTITFDVDFPQKSGNDVFFRYLSDCLDYSAHIYDKSFRRDSFFGGFILYSKYSRRDVCRILNFEKDESATVYGYKRNKANNSCPIFVTYHKSTEISSTTKYEEKFLNNYTFQWMSKSNRKLESPEIIDIISGNLRMPLFIKKSDGESSDFYYMGDISPIQGEAEQTFLTNDKTNSQVPVVKINFRMNCPVEDSIYEYLTS